MEEFTRYAVYYAPEPGPFADFGAAWLGWDAERGAAVAHPDISGLPSPATELTRTPRKYGFHGTLKPPFRLAPGRDRAELERAVGQLAARLAPVRLAGLELARLGGFLALVPRGDVSGLQALAAAVVTGLDGFRAPLKEAELSLRRAAGLSARQEENLVRWGYPYVMEEFRFHLTLTGRLGSDEAQAAMAALEPAVVPVLPEPFVIGSICLFGEDGEGRFRLLHRYALGA